jgi:release factor glutamine methyltransferase
MTVAGLLAFSAAFLAKAGVEMPRLDAGLLLAHALGTTRSILLAHGGNAVSAEKHAAFDEAVARRAAGESVAVITGHKEFRYLDLIVTRDTLVPRPETETLVEAALEKTALLAAGVFLRPSGSRPPTEEVEDGQTKDGGNDVVVSNNVAVSNKSCRDFPRTAYSETASSAAGAVFVLDVGTGSGAVGLSIKYEMPQVHVTLSDISGAALLVARKNGEKQRLSAVYVLSDLFDRIDGTFDIIVSNPPYVRSEEIAALKKEVQNEPRLALDGGNDGLALVKRIIYEGKARLNNGGFLIMEADPRQMSAIERLLLENGYRDVAVRTDLSGNDRVITAAA